MLRAIARLRILHSHRAHCAPDWSWDSRQNRWSGYHVWTIARGRGTFETPEGSHALRAGDCFVLDMREPYRGAADPDHPLVVPAVHFEPLDGRGRPTGIDRTELPLYRRMEAYAFLEGLLGRCIDAHARGDGDLAEQWLRAALTEIAAHDAAPRSFGGDPERAAAIDEMCAEIRAEPGRRRPVPDLARRLHMTPDHFIRVFKARTGVTPGEFVLGERIEAAKHLLRFSSHSVKRIGDILGYADQYFFSRQFAERVGASPVAYRRG